MDGWKRSFFSRSTRSRDLLQWVIGLRHAKFGYDRLRGSGVVAGQILAFPIDFAGRPYNTLTLPCERVMELEGYSWPTCSKQRRLVDCRI